MQLTVNGEERDVPAGSTVESLLGDLGVERLAVVVERNGHVVERGRYGEVTLEPGDRLEIVRFVGGG